MCHHGFNSSAIYRGLLCVAKQYRTSVVMNCIAMQSLFQHCKVGLTIASVVCWVVDQCYRAPGMLTSATSAILGCWAMQQCGVLTSAIVGGSQYWQCNSVVCWPVLSWGGRGFPETRRSLLRALSSCNLQHWWITNKDIRNPSRFIWLVISGKGRLPIADLEMYIWLQKTTSYIISTHLLGKISHILQKKEAQSTDSLFRFIHQSLNRLPVTNKRSNKCQQCGAFRQTPFIRTTHTPQS